MLGEVSLGLTPTTIFTVNMSHELPSNVLMHWDIEAMKYFQR